jgi:hypothetical protein
MVVYLTHPDLILIACDYKMDSANLEQYKYETYQQHLGQGYSRIGKRQLNILKIAEMLND